MKEAGCEKTFELIGVSCMNEPPAKIMAKA